MLTRDQKYASSALERLQKVKPESKTEYKAAAQELPVLVRNAGLVQALTFIQTRGGAHEQILKDVAHTLEYGDAVALVKASRELHLAAYIRLTERVIDALQWYKRLAQVELE